MTRKERNKQPRADVVEAYREVLRRFPDTDHRRAFMLALGQSTGRRPVYGTEHFQRVEAVLRVDPNLTTYEAAVQVATAMGYVNPESVAEGIIAAAERLCSKWYDHLIDPTRREPVRGLDSSAVVMMVRKARGYKANADFRFPVDLEEQFKKDAGWHALRATKVAEGYL
jgi:hypothetical protein